MPRLTRYPLVSALAVSAMLLPACAGQAQTSSVARTPVQAISAKDRQQGAAAHPQLVAEFGGAEIGPQAGYVETIGKNISVHTGLSNARGDFTVTLLNSSVDNAFAIPGGYVYVTRQLVALMNNEAELLACWAMKSAMLPRVTRPSGKAPRPRTQSLACWARY